MNKIYFDTEFEGLFDNAALVSIGLTNSEATDFFYAELSDSYDINKCSDFTKEIVLPLLENNDRVMTLKELRNRLYLWLEIQGKDTILICDSIKDIEQINKLFPQGLPKNCSYQVLGFWQIWKRRIVNINRRVYKKNNLRDHHALDDAIVNRVIFEGH